MALRPLTIYNSDETELYDSERRRSAGAVTRRHLEDRVEERNLVLQLSHSLNLEIALGFLIKQRPGRIQCERTDRNICRHQPHHSGNYYLLVAVLKFLKEQWSSSQESGIAEHLRIITQHQPWRTKRTVTQIKRRFIKSVDVGKRKRGIIESYLLFPQ